jgi:disulfide bond formation protein DsbB
MFLSHFFLALFIAFVIAVIFGIRLRKERTIQEFGIFFLILLLFTWAGGIWISPFGPAYREIPLLPFLFAGLFFALLMAAVLIPRRRSKNVGGLREGDRNGAEEALSLSAILWVLIVGLALVILIAYVV